MPEMTILGKAEPSGILRVCYHGFHRYAVALEDLERAMANPNGICRLCSNRDVLQESHVFSRFLSKDYISDNSKRGGGKVVVLFDTERSNVRQVKRHWLCRDCEQKFSRSETIIAELLRKILDDPKAAHDYNEHFLRFVTSISWRALYYRCENQNRDLIESEIPAFKRWRLFLNDKLADVSPYTQNVFILNDEKTLNYGILNGEFSPNRNFFIVHAGPLLIISRLIPGHDSAADAAIWAESEVNILNGRIEVFERMRDHITLELDSALQQNLRRISDEVMRVHESEQTDRPKTPRQ
jgi:hypothetical protein